MTATKTAAPLDPLVGTATFSRKVSVRQYESAEAGIFVQFDYDRDAEPDDIIAKGRDALTQAKALVFEALGIEAEPDDNGVLMEIVRDFDAKVVTPEPGKPLFKTRQDREAREANEVPAEPPHDPKSLDFSDPEDKSKLAENTEWAKARHESHPDEFWDNRRNKKNPKAPDYKHKDTGVGFWAD